MIYYTKYGKSVELLCRLTDELGNIYLGITTGSGRLNVYFDYNFNVKIQHLPEPVEVIKRLMTDQTINNTAKRGILHLIRLYGKLTETEKRLTKLAHEMTNESLLSLH